MADGTPNSRRYGRWLVKLTLDEKVRKKNKNNPLGIKFEDTEAGIKVKFIEPHGASKNWNDQKNPMTVIKVGDFVLNFKEVEGSWLSTKDMIQSDMKSIIGNMDTIELCMGSPDYKGERLNTKPPSIGQLPVRWQLKSKVFFPLKLAQGRTDVDYTTKIALAWALTPNPKNEDPDRGKGELDIVSLCTEAYPYKYPQPGGVDIYADKGAYTVTEGKNMMGGNKSLEDFTVVRAVRIWYRPAGSGRRPSSLDMQKPNVSVASQMLAQKSKLKSAEAKGGDVPPPPIMEEFEIPPANCPPAETRAKLVEFYTMHDEAKLGVVDALLKKYAGNEGEMWRKLFAKYRS